LKRFAHGALGLDGSTTSGFGIEFGEPTGFDTMSALNIDIQGFEPQALMELVANTPTANALIVLRLL
jgi:hypothetical protein